MAKMNKEKEIFYYKDELVDDFATMENIKVANVDENYKYIHKNPIWNIASILTQNVLSMPVKYLYAKIKFDIKFVGREKLKNAKKRGYFIYANHTQIFADTFIPSLANYPKRNFFIVDPANISMPGLKLLVRLLGAFPLPSNIKAYKNFLNAIKLTIENKHSITIYPEAHIWPYYTKIRNFKAVSFKYPVELNTDVFCLTNTYHKKKNGRIQIISYIDGPFTINNNLTKKEAQQDLRDRVYKQMVERSNNSDYEKIIYKKIENE